MKKDIELEDVEGSKYNLSLEGNMSKDKIIEIFQLMELLELRGQKTNNINNTGSVYRNGNDTNSTIGTAEVEVKQNNKTLVSGSKIWNLIEDKVSSVNFFRCSRDI